MAATVLIKRLAGTAPGQSGSVDITSGNTRMKQADNGTTDTNNPIPAVTTSYSYWGTFQLQVTAAAANAINALKWYTDGSNTFGTGVTAVGQEVTTYVAATSAIVLNTTNYTGLTGAPADIFTFTSGSPKSITGSITNTTGYIGGTTNGMFAYQLAVTSSAAPGATGSETITWQYDET
jgi:hypothetical protein